MERIYFFSCSQLALLLLLPAIEKLSTKFLLVTICSSELQYYTGVQNNDTCYTNTFLTDSGNLYQEIKMMNDKDNQHGSFANISTHKISSETYIQNNVPISDDAESITYDLNDSRSTPDQQGWIFFIDNYLRTTVFKKINRFSMITFKLVDGFKLIYKIPDKPLLAFLA